MPKLKTLQMISYLIKDLHACIWLLHRKQTSNSSFVHVLNITTIIDFY